MWNRAVVVAQLVLSTVYWKDENKEKEAGDGPLKKRMWNNWTHRDRKCDILRQAIAAAAADKIPFRDLNAFASTCDVGYIWSHTY